MAPSVIQIFAHGVQGGITTINIHKDATIKELFTLLSKKNGIPVDQQRAIFAGKELQSEKRLSDYGLQHGSTIYIVLRLLGGSIPPEKELDDEVELSDAPDMITWDDDPENGHDIIDRWSIWLQCQELGRRSWPAPHNRDPPATSDFIYHPLPVYFRVTTLGTPSRKRCRKSRTVFTDLQLRVLEKVFSEQRYLDSTNRAKVSHILGLNEAQVKTWFQNRRMKWKKKVTKSEKPDSSTTTAKKVEKSDKGNSKETATNEREKTVQIN